MATANENADPMSYLRVEQQGRANFGYKAPAATFSGCG